jgi:hypothetical protein
MLSALAGVVFTLVQYIEDRRREWQAEDDKRRAERRAAALSEPPTNLR